ncbi:MAG: hypothetical protein P9X26_10105 [Candidatus Stygibacter frigidus]|nr:hypothetical protein [Candidatus Stygibacter frigidus]
MKKRNLKTRTLNHIQKFSIEMPAKKVIEKIMEKGQENPFVSQFYSVLVSRRSDENLLDAPLNFIVCMDLFKVKKVFEVKRDEYQPNLKTLLLISLINSIMAAQNIVYEANNQKLGTFFLSNSLDQVKTFRNRWNLPDYVIPLTTIAAGYPDEPPKAHHAFPTKFIYFEDEYTPIEDFNIHDLIYKLNNNEDLIEYYRTLTEEGTLQSQQFGDWMELLQFNCQLWDEKRRELDLIIKECGINLEEL